MSFDLRKHADMALYIVVTAIAIALTFSIGTYIVFQLDQAAGGNLTAGVQLLSNQQTLINAAITFLVIAVVAAIGIGLVLYLKGGMGLGGERT